MNTFIPKGSDIKFLGPPLFVFRGMCVWILYNLWPESQIFISFIKRVKNGCILSNSICNRTNKRWIQFQGSKHRIYVIIYDLIEKCLTISLNMEYEIFEYEFEKLFCTRNWIGLNLDSCNCSGAHRILSTRLVVQTVYNGMNSTPLWGLPCHGALGMQFVSSLELLHWWNDIQHGHVMKDPFTWKIFLFAST